MNENLQTQTEISKERTMTYYFGAIMAILGVILFFLHIYNKISEFDENFNKPLGFPSTISKNVENEIKRLQEQGLHEEAEKLIRENIKFPSFKFEEPSNNPPDNFFPTFPFVLIFLGGFLMNIGKRGAYGSGILLNPSKEADDLEPINRGLGKQLGHILNEAGLDKNKQNQIIKVKCTSCNYLNDEEDKFCGNCGKAC